MPNRPLTRFAPEKSSKSTGSSEASSSKSPSASSKCHTWTGSIWPAATAGNTAESQKTPAKKDAAGKKTAAAVKNRAMDDPMVKEVSEIFKVDILEIKEEK